MRERRVDRVVKILNKLNGRARVGEILKELRRSEDNSSLSHTAVYIAIHSENERLEALGQRVRFRTAKQGEEWGWVSLERVSKFVRGSQAQQIEAQILDANRNLDKHIRKRLQDMDWRTFESTFLTAVLEKLGFQDVEITQSTRDGGKDARVSYRRGLVEAKAIVSAKRWAARTSVPVDEIRLMRGIKGDEDTAIIITTSGFTADAQREARPSQNQRVVYLIDGDRLVDICKQHGIGVKKVQLPPIFTVDEESFTLDETDDLPQPRGSHPPNSPAKLRRFRTSMLKELPASEIADWLGLAESTVLVYLSDPEQTKKLAERIRANDETRAKALTRVGLKRKR